MSVLPTTQQQRLATFRAPACQRYYASRLAAESPHPSTFDVPRGIYRPSTTGTKMLVKRAWTLEDVVADPDTFEFIRHPSREPFTLPLWVRHGLRTAATQHVFSHSSLQHNSADSREAALRRPARRNGLSKHSSARVRSGSRRRCGSLAPPRSTQRYPASRKAAS